MDCPLPVVRGIYRREGRREYGKMIYAPLIRERDFMVRSDSKPIGDRLATLLWNGKI